MPRKKTLEPMGERLARLRRERGLTQEELADRVGIAQPNLSDYERGISIPTAPMVVRISQALCVSTDTLLGVEPVNTEAAKLDPGLLRRMRKLEEMSRRDRQAMLRVFDALIERGRNETRRRARSG